MVVVANVANVIPWGTMNNATFTDVVLSRRISKLVLNVETFRVQKSYNSAMTLSGSIIYQ